MARAAPGFSTRTAACGPRAELGKQRRDQRGSDHHREDHLERADRSGIVRVVRIDEQNGEPAGGDQEEKEREAGPFESPTHPPIIEGAPMKKPTPGLEPGTPSLRVRASGLGRRGASGRHRSFLDGVFAASPVHEVQRLLESRVDAERVRGRIEARGRIEVAPDIFAPASAAPGFRYPMTENSKRSSSAG